MQPTEPHFPWSLDKSPAFLALLASLSDRLRSGLSGDGFGPIEQLVAEAPPEHQATIFEQLVIEEAQLRMMRGAEPTLEEYLQRFPNRATLVESAWRKLQSHPAPSTVDHQGGASDAHGTEPDGVEIAGSEPTHFGVYKVLRPLGSGTFGSVFKAQHDSTGEVVAIKMLKRRWASDPDCGQAMRRQFAEEAKMMLQFEHPHVVRVISLDDGADPPYIVQQYIDGETLDNRLRAALPSLRQSLEYAIQIADGLAHIHAHECWHRDLKPANILLDRNNHVYLADFGLALDEAQRWSSKTGVAGTYPYMAPEQIKGATHRLNARCDIWALGVILYEMLTGRRPFRSRTREQLCEDVMQRTPPTPRELNQAIPRELNRLCMQCLSKRDADRPHAAADVRDDLAQILQAVTEALSPIGTTPAATQATEPDNRAKAESSTEYPVPTLKRFTAEQAELYLRLMPRGYATAEELPELITFWKTRIIESDPDQTFAVGIMVGVSGCGKSSMLEAGLVPALPESIIPILIEASETDTEVRILNKLHRALPEADPDKKWSLVDWTFRIRSGNVLPQGKKVVFVLDQFEQWLNAHGGEPTNQLLDALHQCDGEHLQAIVCVREGFHATLMRFVEALTFKLDEERNYATAHRFTPDHARFVLTQFGRGLKRVDNPPTSQQQAFIDATIDALAESDRGVVCVRLAVLALVLQDRPWSVEELNQLGGLDGIGSQFLVDCFEGRTASEQYRRYLPAAMRVLAELLPAEGLEIKDVRSYEQLLAASELDKLQFDDLLNILVRKLFLLTPVEQISFSSSSSSLSPQASGLYYQLTHDFLVPTIRDWLSRKLRETKAGRAQLRLQELTTTWTSKPQNRNLPSLWEWITIRRLTDGKKWKASEQTVMRRAGRVHATRGGLFASAIAILAVVGFVVRGQVLSQQETTRIEGLVARLVSAEPNQLLEVIAELDASSEIATTYLSPLLTKPAETLDDKRSQLHARLALVARDKSLLEPLLEELLTNKVAYIRPIRQQLQPYAAELTEQLQVMLRDAKADAKRRFRAALALANYIPETEASSWTAQDLQFVAGQLVMENAEFQPQLRENLRPISERLLTDLAKIFGDPTATDAQRLGAANAFADYAASDIARLSELLIVATPEQYAVLFPIVAASPGPTVVEELRKMAATLPSDDLGSVARVSFGQQRANAAVTLMRLGKLEMVLPVFDYTDDPEALTQFIFRCRDRDVRVEELLECLRIVSNGPTERYPRNTRYALLLALGEYTLAEIPESQQAPLLTQLGDWYRNNPSSGIHGAAGWLLRQWGQAEIVRMLDQTPVPYSIDREWFTLAITVTPTSPLKSEEMPTDENTSSEAGTKTASPSEGAASEEEGTEQTDKSNSSEPAKDEAKPEPPPEPMPPRTFYYTFIVFPAGESLIGSVEDEPERQVQENRELRHRVNLTQPFALLDREVTFEELIAFSPSYARYMQQLNAQPADAGFGPHWYDSVAFCRWLSEQSGLSESDQSYADPESLRKEEYPREPDAAANWAPRNWPLELGRRGLRLPTESEWEIASRAGARTAYGHGSDVALLGQFGWFVENSGKQVHPPRKLRPSVRGLYDLHGNLFEYTHDWYGAFGESAVTDPLGVKEGTFRVDRGGGWAIPAAYCRSAMRNSGPPSLRTNGSGFRIALSSPSGVSSPSEQVQVAEPSSVGSKGVAEQRPEMP